MRKQYEKLPMTVKEVIPSLLILFLMGVVFSVMSPRFLTVNNLSNVLLQSTNTAIVGAGLIFVMICGDIDLSGGSMIALTAVLAGKMLVAGVNVPLVVVLSLLLGATVGAFNGFCVTRIHLVPFIVTLAVSTMASGLALGISGGKTIYNLPDSFTFLGAGKINGVSVAVVLMLLLYAVCHVTMSKSVFGHQIYAVGGNREAAFLAGVNVKRVEMTSFIIAGICNSFAGIILTGRLGTALATIGSGTEMNALSGLVLGGVSMAGGCGNAIGAFIGCLTIAMLNNGLNMMNVSTFWTDFTRGLIILIAIVIDAARRMKVDSE